MKGIIDHLFDEITKETLRLGPLYSQRIDDFHTELTIVYQYGAPDLEKEHLIRRIHDIATTALKALTFKDLHEVATIQNTKRIWQMPTALNDTPRNRRRLHAHAMKHLIQSYALATFPRLKS